jgi:hypothetical protein
VNKAQAEDSDLYFDSDGKPHLRQLARQPSPEKAEEVETILKATMPERHLLYIPHHAHYWVGYTRHFGPPSSFDPNRVTRYLVISSLLWAMVVTWGPLKQLAIPAGW